MSITAAGRIDIDKPLWDQNTFIGRFKHFAWVTDPTTVFTSDEDLNKAKQLVEQYRVKKEPAGTTQEQIISAKKLYESAFHPDTGEKQNFIGRMSFQMPGGMLITGGMLSFYRSVPAVILWQWINQSFNALVNYTNRNANSPLTVNQLGFAYVTATTGALVAALGCKNYWQKNASPFMQRYVPFTATATANCINIPLMRQQEIINGIDVCDEGGHVIGTSRLAAVKGISQVVFSRICMAAPAMMLMPVFMEKLEKINWFKRMQVLHSPFQTMAAGAFLLIMVPSACALFPQRCSIKMSTIERFENEQFILIKQKNEGKKLPERVYFNKGL